MAAGDLFFSRAVDGVCEVPCCKCGPAIFGNSFLLDLSGIGNCGCLETGAGEAFEIRDQVGPGSMELVWNGSSGWESVLSGSADLYNSNTGSCDDMELNFSGQFLATAACLTEGEFAGQPMVTVRWISAGPIIGYYQGRFPALGDSAPNLLAGCGVSSLRLWDGGGIGTITAP